MSKVITLALALFTLGFAGCATAPKSVEGRQKLEASADDTLGEMVASDPGLRGMLDQSAGYAVFSEIGKGGLVVGGASGRGALYEHGALVGYVQLNQASVGLQAGGETFSELIVFHDADQLQRVKAESYDLGGNVSATVLTTGAAAAAQFTDGVVVFVVPRGGLMVDVSVAGQQIRYVGRG